VPAYEFYFAIELSGPGASTDMLRDLASRVLGQAGCSGDDVPEVVEAVQEAVRRIAAAGEPRCGVRFHADSDQIEIVVSSAGSLLWRAVHLIT
jgi:anti-sigma regulatory factor (Ser/Thr protein kinase)